jgi:uncharacterized protein YndB with AHSA1/START domain
MATAKRGQDSIQIAAAPEAVYDLIADVTRMGEWSPECYRCEWLDAATTAEVGARFRGHNQLGRFRWQTTAVITAADRGSEFAFTVVHDGTGREETTWRYLFEPSAGGTLLTESFEFLWCPLGNRVVELFVPRGSQVNRGIHQTLQRIAATAEAAAPGADLRANPPPPASI